MKDFDNEQDFEVVAYEIEEGLIEVQFFDGDIEEFEHDIWYEMTLAKIPPPEDWSGAIEVDEDGPGTDDGIGLNEGPDLHARNELFAIFREVGVINTIQLCL